MGHAMQTYQGACQCGAVSWEAEADLSQPIACNCSRCQRLGAMLVFIPRASFRLLTGEDHLSEYLFNRRVVHHYFCRTCGIESFAYGAMPDGTEIAALNVNCIEGIDPRTLTPTYYDGRSM
jgi:hypothetical protein